MVEKRLTYKERVLIKGVICGKTQTQAAIDAGYSKRSAAVLACKTLKKVNVQDACNTALSLNDLSLSDVIKPLADGLSAVKVNKYNQLVPDHNIRLKTAIIILNLMGLL